MKPILLVGLGGALGSMWRYWMQVTIAKYITITFPLGTFIVNLTGCFLIGLLYSLTGKYTWLTVEWRLFLITGICGGYTTFSSFSYESILLFRQGSYLYFFMYVLGSVILGLLATVLGTAIIK